MIKGNDPPYFLSKVTGGTYEPELPPAPKELNGGTFGSERSE